MFATTSIRLPSIYLEQMIKPVVILGSISCSIKLLDRGTPEGLYFLHRLLCHHGILRAAALLCRRQNRKWYRSELLQATQAWLQPGQDTAGHRGTVQQMLKANCWRKSFTKTSHLHTLGNLKGFLFERCSHVCFMRIMAVTHLAALKSTSSMIISTYGVW